jgi:hypothetical protein
MRVDQQWTAANFASTWSLFKMKHPSYLNWEYIIASDVVTLWKSGKQKEIVGYVYDIGSWPYEMAENHLLNVLRREEDEARRKKEMADAQKERMQEALEKGQQWARFAIALNPNMDQAVVQEMATEFAQLLGFNDMKSGIAFVQPIMKAFRDYQENNIDFLGKAVNLATKQHLLQQANTDLEQTN